MKTIHILGVLLCAATAVAAVDHGPAVAGALMDTIPQRTKEEYSIKPLGPTTNEHLRTVRRGRYITLCYWVTTADAKEKVQFTHCITEKEMFNGH